MVAEPEPLSFMPGPSSTESRCAPTPPYPGGPSEYRNYVFGRPLLDSGIDREPQGNRALLQEVIQLPADGERGAYHGYGHLRRVERSEEVADAVVVGDHVALVEDYDAHGARRHGVVDLLSEGAGSALDQGDVTGLEAGKVRRLYSRSQIRRATG